jgi:hypothetical protein
MVILIFSLIAIVAGIYVVSNWTKEQTVVVRNDKPIVIKEITYYDSYCWKCGKGVRINSRLNKLCPKCKKYYICDICGKCLCDKEEYDTHNKATKIKKYWELSDVKESRKVTSSNTCIICGKKIISNKNHKLCLGCWKEAEISGNNNARTQGYCQKCGKKLRGDTSKKLCFSCWKAN